MASALTVKSVCERYGVGERTVLLWIARGELRAINVGRAPGKAKPRWRITEEALSAFEFSRTTSPAVPKRRRGRGRQSDVIEFYPTK